MLSYSYQPEEKAIAISIKNDLLSTNLTEIRESILAYINSNEINACEWEAINLDLKSARMIDSMGLNFLVELTRKAKRSKRTMNISVGNQNILKSLSFIKLDKHANIQVCND